MRQSERGQPALGAAIKQLREKRDLSQEALAAKADLTGRTVSAIETATANPTWATVKEIAAALGVTMVELARLAEQRESR
jgi:transcriptional regulator with XRE-family HTH domain